MEDLREREVVAVTLLDDLTFEGWYKGTMLLK